MQKKRNPGYPGRKSYKKTLEDYEIDDCIACRFYDDRVGE